MSNKYMPQSTTKKWGNLNKQQQKLLGKNLDHWRLREPLQRCESTSLV